MLIGGAMWLSNEEAACLRLPGSRLSQVVDRMEIGPNSSGWSADPPLVWHHSVPCCEPVQLFRNVIPEVSANSNSPLESSSPKSRSTLL